MSEREPEPIDPLPPVRGRYSRNVAMAGITWFRVGGPADVVFRPADEADLADFLRQCPASIPVLPIGVGSNVLVRDGGIRGIVVRLGRGFVEVGFEGDRAEVGAGALDVNVALAAREAGMAGLEFLRGVPGTIGGGLRMNAGAYGREFKEVLIGARAIDRAGTVHEVAAADLDLGYRHCGAPADWIFTAASFAVHPDRPAAIEARMAAIHDRRQESQPVRARTGGSTFKNPAGRKAWELIDAAGCRGLGHGGARVSEQHCNFLINEGHASAADLESLGETVRQRVQASQGVDLEWEIKRIGERIGERGGAPGPRALP